MKDCGKHSDCECERRRFYRRLFAFLLALVILVLLAILIIWLVLRPTKPRFYLEDASVSQFNVSDANLLSVTIQVTVSSRNPNDRVGVYYDRLDIFAAYRYQQITIPTAIPPFYQGHKDFDVWSPYLCGVTVPVAPYLTDALRQDEADGFLLLRVKLAGRIRWKVGSWTSGHYRLFVDCPAFLSFRDGHGAGDPPVVKFQRISECSVSV